MRSRALETCLLIAGIAASTFSMQTLSAQAGDCDYYLGTAVTGQSVAVDLCSIQQVGNNRTNFTYSLGSEAIAAQANCGAGTWTTFPEGAVNSPQSQSTQDMVQIVCTAPSFNEGIAIGVVFDPPSNIRTSPNGDILCTVQQLSAIAVFGGITNDGWMRTDICGPTGVIHQSQVRFP